MTVTKAVWHWHKDTGQQNRVVSQETDPHIATWFSKDLSRQFNAERKVLLINYTGITGYPRRRKLTLAFNQ